jgi:hypothetical protein
MHIKRYRRILVAPPALMSALAATLLLATTTLAAPGNGAQVFKDSFCFDYEGSTICQSNMSITTETTTPSGNTLFTGNGRSSYIQTDPSGAVYEDSLSAGFDRLASVPTVVERAFLGTSQ